MMKCERPAPIQEAPLRCVTCETPAPRDHEVRLRVALCGICLTDLHLAEGDIRAPGPFVPGHQIVGRVDALGPMARRFTVGDRAGLGWLAGTCGRCRFCHTDRENLCLDARFTGRDLPGGYADWVVADEQFVYPIPDALTDLETVPLLCAGIIGYRALRQTGATAGARLGLFGFGASAHITIQIARHLGMEVYVFTRSDGHRRLAAELGAAWVGGAEDNPPHRLDAAIIFAPAGWLVPLALRLTERGGTVALAGIHMSPVPELSYDEHLYWERSVRSVANNTRADGADLLRLAAEIPIRTRTTVYPLEAANEALAALKHSRIDGAGVLQIAPTGAWL